MLANHSHRHYSPRCNITCHQEGGTSEKSESSYLLILPKYIFLTLPAGSLTSTSLNDDRGFWLQPGNLTLEKSQDFRIGKHTHTQTLTKSISHPMRTSAVWSLTKLLLISNVGIFLWFVKFAFQYFSSRPSIVSSERLFPLLHLKNTFPSIIAF